MNTIFVLTRVLSQIVRMIQIVKKKVVCLFVSFFFKFKSCVFQTGFTKWFTLQSPKSLDSYLYEAYMILRIPTHVDMEETINTDADDIFETKKL